jgi:hypothetical protein
MPDENEVIEQPTQEEIAQADSAEEAAFAASVSGEEVRADNAPTDNDEQAADDEQLEADDANGDDEGNDGAQDGDNTDLEQDQPTEQEQLAAMLAKLPKIDELENMTTAEIRKVHGKLGEINRAVLELQKNQGNTGAINLSGVKLKRLQEEYPELAELLSQDLSESGAAVTEGTQPTVNFNDEVAKVREDLSKEMQANLLTIQHRDWRGVIQSPDFAAWKQTLPEADQNVLDNSWNAIELGEKLTQFKSYSSQRQAGATQRKQRMERAITPKGTTAPIKQLPMTEEDGFAAAFRS